MKYNYRKNFSLLACGLCGSVLFNAQVLLAEDKPSDTPNPQTKIAADKASEVKSEVAPDKTLENKTEAAPAVKTEIAPDKMLENKPEAAPDVKADPKKPGKTKAKPAVKKENPNYHENTPAELSDKLTIGLGFSIGGGNKTVFSSDLLAYYINTTYDVIPLPFLSGLSLFGEGSVYFNSGVKKGTVFSYNSQSYLLGAGAKYIIPGLPHLNASSSFLLGMQKTTSWEVIKYKFSPSTYGLSSQINVRANYDVYEKIELGVGFTSIIGKKSWYGGTLGSQMYF